ncbi:hypothetical protein VTL71DRAFT_5195 [Oculimacula yallundae]|uniref:Uncharacterized protein n=1 Tax=Oculimacula yallundae TaxID=86028 RepID=A0ABR4C0E6_9HELO
MGGIIFASKFRKHLPLFCANSYYCPIYILSKRRQGERSTILGFAFEFRSAMGHRDLLSVLKVLNIKMEVISIPLVKTWTPTQFKKAEVLITFLAGRLVTDGGCNPKQPGTSAGRLIGSKFEDERRELFIDRELLGDNINVATQQMEKPLQMINWLRDVKKKPHVTDNMTFEELLEVATNPLIPAIGKMHADSKRVAEGRKQHLARIKDPRKELEAIDDSLLDELREYKRNLTDELESHKAVDAWLEVDSDEEDAADEAVGSQSATVSQDAIADGSTADGGVNSGTSGFAARLKLASS